MTKPSLSPKALFLLAFALLAAFVMLPTRKTSPLLSPPARVVSQTISPVISIADAFRAIQDAPTGRGFKLNADGSLAEAPTKRLEFLNALAKTNLQAAAVIARQILASKTSPDEWALSLAILARADSSDATRQFLRQKAEEMALYGPWRQNPSAGFLEAFDVFVYTGDVAFVPDLADMVTDKSNPALAHAAFLTLDRLTQDNPAAALQTFLDDPSLLAGRAATEAGLFARADARDPAQQQLLAQYLLSPDLSLTELETFAGLFPNENFIVSHNLLTPNPVVPNFEIRSRFDAATQLVAQWQVDPRFQSLGPQLAQIQSRLARVLAVR